MKDNEEMEFLPMDYGLIVKYEGDENNVLYDGGVKQYGIGEMMCELARVNPLQIKTIILENDYLEEKFEPENVEKAFLQLEKKLCKEFGVASSKIITSEFLISSEELYKNKEEPEYWKVIEETKNWDVRGSEYIFKDTPFDTYGYKNIGQALLTAYLQFWKAFTLFKYMFDGVMREEMEQEEDESVGNIIEVFGHWMGIQNIEYRLANIEGRLSSLYTIKDSISLFAFELAHSVQKDINFKKCKNCGNYFALSGRSDAVYCSYIDPKHTGRRCREIGAQITRANKEKSDIITREYRKVYMRLNMQKKRHPGNIEVNRRFDRLTDEMKSWRKKLENGSTTTEQFLDWLKTF